MMYVLVLVSWLWADGGTLYHVMWDAQSHGDIVPAPHTNIHRFIQKGMTEKGKIKYGKPVEDIAIWNDSGIIFVRYYRQGRKPKYMQFKSHEELQKWLQRHFPDPVVSYADSVYLEHAPKSNLEKIIEIVSQGMHILKKDPVIFTATIVPIPAVNEILFTPNMSKGRGKIKIKGNI